MKISDIHLPDAVRGSFAHLIAKLGEQELPAPAGWRLLVLQYVRPERSSGGIIFADKTKDEDKWQGRVGLVLATGPACWRDPARYPEGMWAQVGDVVMWPKLDNASTRFEYEGVSLAIINDDSVCAVGVDAAKAIG